MGPHVQSTNLGREGPGLVRALDEDKLDITVLIHKLRKGRELSSVGVGIVRLAPPRM